MKSSDRIRIKETDSYVDFALGKYYTGQTRTTREQKWITIGGPFDGQVLSPSQAGPEYRQFNRSGSFKDVPKQVNIHNSLLALIS